MMNRNLALTSGLLAASFGLVLAPANAQSLSGQVVIDGSSTVAPISIAASEGFSAENSGVQVPVGTSGTGGGFEKFCAGSTDISNASRPIEPDEMEKCKANGVEYVEIPIAFDALTVVTNKANDWAQCLTVEELTATWGIDAEGTVTSWDQIREDFPGEPLALFAPGTDSGTFDYFVEAVLDDGDIRADFTPSEDDNVIVTGVEGSPGGLGFFGFAYYEENADQLNALQIDGGNGCVSPTVETVENGTYAPLSRPLFIYVSKAAAERPEVKAFVDYYIANAAQLATSVGYIQLPAEAYTGVTDHWNKMEVGSQFQEVAPGTPIGQMFK